MEISPIEFLEADKFHQLCLLGDGKGEGEVTTGVESHLTWTCFQATRQFCFGLH